MMSDELLNWERARETGIDHNSSLVVVDIGGTRIKLGGILNGTPIDTTEQFYVEGIRHGDIVENLANCIEDFRSKNSFNLDGVIVTVPGFIDRDFDRVLKCDNVRELEDRLLASELTRNLNVPVVLERDSVLLLKGEYSAGAAQHQEDVAGIFIGTGIGASYLQSGHPFRGGGWALEIGHIPVWSNLQNLQSSRNQTLEDYCSGAELRQIAKKYGVSIDSLFSLTTDNSDFSTDLDLTVRLHAFAVSTIISMISPRVILVGGGVVSMGGYPFDRLRELVMVQAPLADWNTPVDIRQAALGWESVLHGATAFLEDSRCD